MRSRKATYREEQRIQASVQPIVPAGNPLNSLFPPPLRSGGNEKPMIDPITYERYSVPLEQKMFELEALLRDFLQAVQMCSQSAGQEFLREAEILGSELAGRPGDAALGAC
jgi:hypothetical protein